MNINMWKLNYIKSICIDLNEHLSFDPKSIYAARKKPAAYYITTTFYSTVFITVFDFYST